MRLWLRKRECARSVFLVLRSGAGIGIICSRGTTRLSYSVTVTLLVAR